jgi:tRNA A-37 threonylcarbamoyl transferase component Bud32/tetratricopeptide (TPR) repeat protein
VADLRDELVSALAGRYDVERELGHGGMAYVYLARDLKHDRRVAIKVLKPELATSIGVERFLREIRITARLEHPNIVRLYASDNVGDTLLYYVVQYVPGDTLRRKLDRETQLPLDEAIAITRQVAAALDYAHAHGVIHRDIKPANILLHDNQVVVADFGLARMYDTADNAMITQSAMVMGTPTYMSPEQIAGDAELDGRTDIYSLACVFFEMVAGSPPFHATTRQGIYGLHLSAPPPSLCAEREQCPPEMDAAVHRAMAKVPADRFRTAAEFVRALEGEPQGTGSSGGGRSTAKLFPPASRRWATFGGASVAAAGLVAAVMLAIRHSDPMAAAPLDPAAYVVLPLNAQDTRADSAAVTERLIEALGEWDGVRIIDARSTSEEMARVGRQPLRLTDATRVTRGTGAGRLVWAESAREGDSIIVRASLYDAITGKPIRSRGVSYKASDRAPLQPFRQLANALLRSGNESPWAGGAPRPRQSLIAWLAYDEGRAAAAQWDLGTAEQKFRDALAADPEHARANLWLARMLIWSGQPRDAWRAAAKRALELRGQLTQRDVLAAEAQVALADSRFPEACEKYSRMVALDTSDFAGWFGLGECVVRDSVVVADGSSVSGFRFRSSWQRAVDAYLHIINEIPSPHPEFVYARVQRVLVTESNTLRMGHGMSGAPEFDAYASRDADSIAFVPYPTSGKVQRQRVLPRSLLRVMEQNRAVLRDVYASWVRDAPRSLNARLALAGSLETAGELASDVPDRPAALSQIRAARELVTDPVQRIALARAEIRLLVKIGEWRLASRLVDSLFRAVPHPTAPATKELIGLAALSGRAQLTSEMFLLDAPGFDVPLPVGGQSGLSPELRRDLARMRSYASLGVCVETMRDFPARVDRLLESSYNEPRLRAIARDALLRRPLSLAAPCLGVRPLLGIADGGDREVTMQQALARGDRPTVREQFDSLRMVRASSRPGDVAIEYTYLEAWLRTQIGDTAAAVRQLDRSLDALPTLGSFLMDMPSQAGGLVRAMMLRAELAIAKGDVPNASRWANAVATLWENADPELQPYVKRMRSIAASAH